MKRSTRRKVHYYGLLDQRCCIIIIQILILIYSRGSEQVLLFNQLGHACGLLKSPYYTKEGPLFVRKEPTRRIAWLTTLLEFPPKWKAWGRG